MSTSTINYLSEIYTATSVAQRENISILATELALKELLSSAWSDNIIIGTRPPAGEVMTLNTTNYSTTDSNSILNIEIALQAYKKDRNTLYEEFATLALMFPIFGDEVDDIQFEQISLKDDITFSTDEEYYSATLTLNVQVELLASTFATPEATDSEYELSPLQPQILELALKNYLTSNYDIDSTDLESSWLILNSLSSISNGYQNAEVTIKISSTERDSNFDALANLISNLPLENIDIELTNGSEILIERISCSSDLNITFNEYWQSTLVLSLTLNALESSFDSADTPSSDDSESESESESDEPTITPKTFIDPVETEENLTNFLATQLSLTVDIDIWRGVIPSGKCGVGVQFQSQLFNSENSYTESTFKIFQRSKNRNEAMQNLSSTTAIFPITATIGAAEILCTQALITPIIEQGTTQYSGEITLLLKF